MFYNDFAKRYFFQLILVEKRYPLTVKGYSQSVKKANEVAKLIAKKK